MAASQQWVTIFFFKEITDSSQLRSFEVMRSTFHEKWGHLLSEDGQWWGREVGKHERVWEVVFWKDEHGAETVRSDPAYSEFEASFFKGVSPPDAVVHNVPVRGTTPLREVLQAGVNFVGYYRLTPDQSASGWDAITDTFLKVLDYPGWRGGAYVSAKDGKGEAISFGGWNSVEESMHLFEDGRFADLMDRTNDIFDKAARTFNSHVKFYKHV